MFIHLCEYACEPVNQTTGASRVKELERYFKALADSNRLRILNLLLHGELCVCDIQYVLQASQPNVSRHLSYLKNSGLVLDRRDGSRMFYRLVVPMERNKKRLFDFFQDASKDEKQLRSDKKRLREAVATGACTLSEWKPFSAVTQTKALHSRA